MKCLTYWNKKAQCQTLAKWNYQRYMLIKQDCFKIQINIIKRAEKQKISTFLYDFNSGKIRLP
ncbi:hypothetical protein SAMN03159332_6171 [Paenibacillus sp. 276b]|nr:hypothetical protein SAMN03159332_6171 [Paenibacillus sp. 276b]